MSKKEKFEGRNLKIKVQRNFEHLSYTDLSQSLNFIYSPWLKFVKDEAEGEERKVSHEAVWSISSRVHGTTIGGDKP